MAEAKIRVSSTQKLIAAYPHCALCGGARPSSTREHVPPTCLFDNAHRPRDPVIPACDLCNRATSTADLVAGVLSRLRYEPNQVEHVDSRRLTSRLRKQAPEIVTEWTKLSPKERRGGKRLLKQHGVHVPLGFEVISIGPETIAQLNLFAHKLAIGFYFVHLGEHLTNGGGAWATWQTKEDIQRFGMPHDFLKLLPNRNALRQGSWDTSKTFEYRHSENISEGLFGFVARLRVGLTVTGFAVRDLTTLDEKEDEKKSWIRPSELLQIQTDPQHRKRS